MNDFTFYNPTKLIFGKGQVEQLKELVPQYGKKVLVVYGGGSIKRNGLYDQVMSVLKEVDSEVFELSGVEPNPRLSTVRQRSGNMPKRRALNLFWPLGAEVSSTVRKPSLRAQNMREMRGILYKKTFAKEALPFGTVLT